MFLCRRFYARAQRCVVLHKGVASLDSGGAHGEGLSSVARFQSGAYWIRICRCLLIRTFNGGRLMPNCGFPDFSLPFPHPPHPTYSFSEICFVLLSLREKKDAIIVVPLPIYNSCWVLIPLLFSLSLHRFAWTVIEYSVSFLFNYELFL